MMSQVALPQLSSDSLSNFYFLYEDVTQETSREICTWIFENNFLPVNEKPNNLNLIINTDGGSLYDAFAIIDFMSGSDIPVNTIGVGTVASAGLLLLMSGSYRTLSENASILSHQFATGNSVVKKHELLALQKENNNTQERLLKHIAKCTQLGYDDINDKLMPPSDVYLTAEECITYGLIDKVVTLR